MNENKKSPQDDVELDFNNPKTVDNIVDEAMLQSRVGQSSDAMKGMVVIIVVIAILGYSFFSGKKTDDKTVKVDAAQQVALDSKKKVIVPDNIPSVAPAPIEKNDKPIAMEQSASAAKPQEPNVQVEVKPNTPSAPEPAAPKDVPSAKSEMTTQPVKENSNPVAPVMPQQKTNPPVESNKNVAPKDISKVAPVAPAQLPANNTATPAQPSNAGAGSPDLSGLIMLMEQQQKQLMEMNQHSDEQLQKLNQNMAQSVKKNADDLMKSLQLVQEQQKNLENALKQMTAQMQNHDNELKRIDQFVHNQIADFAQPMGIVPAPEAPKFIVHAIIPGRAWLRGHDQKIFSVTEGEEMPNYGKVLTIDPRLGTVIFSSGQVLRYS